MQNWETERQSAVIIIINSKQTVIKKPALWQVSNVCCHSSIPVTTMNRLIAYLLIFSVMVDSCATSKLQIATAPLPNSTNRNEFNLTYKLTDVQISDERKEVDSTDIRIPGLSTPGQHRKASPKLKMIQQDTILSYVKLHFQNSGKNAVVIVHIQEAYKEFSVTSFREVTKSFASIQLEIRLQTGDTNYLTSTAETVQSSSDANKKKLEHVYVETIKKCIHNCLRQMKNNSS